MKFTRHLSFTIFLSAVVWVSGAAAQNSKEMRDATELVNKASTVVTEVMNVGDKAIPSDLLSKAKAIVVFPGSFKAAFIIGGQGGHGVAVRRTANGWSAPAFLKMGGGSVGAQIGGEKTDYVLLIMNDMGLNSLLQDKFEIGAEGSIVAGPVGRTAAASTNATLDAEILSYSRSKGLFAGLALKGVVISADKDMNNAIYKKSSREILGGSAMAESSAPEAMRAFSRTVGKYAR